MSDVKLNAKKCQQGLDGLNAVYKIALDGMNKLYLEKEVLKNKEGNSIVEIDCVGGKVRVILSISLYTFFSRMFELCSIL